MNKFFVNAALVLAPFLLLEGAFRFLPVAYLPPILPVSAETPVARFEPNVDYRYSRDWNFSVVTRKRSNNYGFINTSDYRPEERSPLLAVIGDSLVEANQVDAGKSVGEVLNAALGAEGRVYGLGISGAPLSQYLVYAEFARKTFGANAMAFVVAPNDFDESLLKYKADPRFHYFAEDGALRRVDYELSTTRKILRHSAVLRYMMQNLDAGQRLHAMWNKPRSREAPEQRLADAYRAVDHFLDQLPEKSGLGRESIVFVLDPWRPAIYSPETWAQAQNTLYGKMPRYFAAQAAARGYEVIELHPVFMRLHQSGASLEIGPTDSHWNALGHQVVAGELARSAVFRRVFSAAPKLRTVSTNHE